MAWTTTEAMAFKSALGSVLSEWQDIASITLNPASQHGHHATLAIRMAKHANAMHADDFPVPMQQAMQALHQSLFGRALNLSDIAVIPTKHPEMVSA